MDEEVAIAECLSRRAFTVEDVARMIAAGIVREDERSELIEGEIVMTPARNCAHERVKSALNIAAIRALPDDLTIGTQTTLRLTGTTMLEPDIAVFPRKVFEEEPVSGFAQLDPGEAELVIEVAVSSLA